MKACTLICFIILMFAGCSPEVITREQLFDDVIELSSDAYQGRKTGTRGGLKAAEYITTRFNTIGLLPYQNNFKHHFDVLLEKNKRIKGFNLIGFIPGRSKKNILISAHYDHLGIKNGQIYHGADDNASGVAGLLKIAGYFMQNQPEHTLVFACFDAEEMGLQGSKAFVKNPPFPLGHIQLNINLDMISRADKGELFACGTKHFPHLKKHVQQKHAGIKILFGHDDPASGKNDWTDQSDHYPFFLKHIPFIYFGVEDHADYHKPGDMFDKINKVYFKAAVNAILNTVIKLDKQLAIQRSFRDNVLMEDNLQ